MKIPSKILEPTEAEIIAQDLADFWHDPIARRAWQQRLELIEKIDEEIKFFAATESIHRHVSTQFTSLLIERLTEPTVTCLPQVYIYLNSANLLHRQAAWAWLVLHDTNNPMLQALSTDNKALGSEKRTETRHELDLFSTLAVNDNQFQGRLIDISKNGAKMAVTADLPKGTRVEMVVPLLGRVAAVVVWAAATAIGLAFIGPQAGMLGA